MFDKEQLFNTLDSLLEDWKVLHHLEFLDEVAMKRVVRKGKIVRKVKVKKKGYKVVRKGNSIRFVRMTAQEKRIRRRAARKAWRVGRAARKNKAKRSLIRSKVRMKTLYGK
jgi:DNA-binding transcriptional regulator PaaX